VYSLQQQHFMQELSFLSIWPRVLLIGQSNVTLNPSARYWSIPQFKRRQYALLLLVQPLHCPLHQKAHFLIIIYVII